MVIAQQTLPLSAIPRADELAYTERFSEKFLDGKRRRGDPASDAVIDRLSREGSIRGFHDLLGAVREQAAAGDAACQALLDHGEQVPDWADFDRMRRGQALIAAFPVHMGLSLFSGSLCGGAVFLKMTLITAMTGMLSGDSNRRLDETMKMVVGMAFPGAVQPGEEGHELLVRVRLLHSGIRRHLVESGRYRHPTEVPISQQDLAITLALFGYLNLRSLAKMGVSLPREDVESYMLLWRYAGYVLGIDEDLLPWSVEEQREFFFASLKHQGRPEKLSPKTKVVLDNVARSATDGAPWAFPVVQKFLHQTCRWLSGNDYVTGMEFEDAGENYWGFRALQTLGTLQSAVYRRLPSGDRALAAVGRLGYRRFLARAHATRDREGEYRVRMASTARPARAEP
jgi:hypothetical protein